jgi:hypothetical protein
MTIHSPNLLRNQAKKSRPRRILLRIYGEPHAHRGRHLAAVLAHTRAHRARPSRHGDVAAAVFPLNRHGVHAAWKGALLLLHANPHHTLRWRWRRGVRRSWVRPREQRVDVACDVRAGTAALGTVVREQ